jgi:uracil-DNA glycosylase family 4
MAKKKFFSTATEPVDPCASCTLKESCKSPKLPFIGKGKKNVLIIGAQPSSREDLKGALGYGSEMEFLADSLEEIGVDLWKDCFYTTAVACRPPRNRVPSSAELKACRGRLDRVVERMDPVAVVLLGEVPFNYMVAPRISGRLTGTPAKDFYGETIPDQELGRWIVPTWSPADMLECRTYEDGGISKPYYQRDEAVFRRWKKDLAQAFKLEPFEKIDYASMCKTTQDIDVALDWIDEAMGWEYNSFDLETNSIKCYREGSRIISVSWSNGKIAYSCPFFEDNTFRRSFKRLMLNEGKKICHNTSFEYQWIKQKEGYYINHPDIDTMLMAHCIDSHKPTGLKFETYTRLGVISYDESCDKYIKSSTAEKEKYGDNAFNTLIEAPLDEVLLYNAQDSLYTYLIFEQMRKELDEFQWGGYKFLNESSIWLTRAQVHGFLIDIERYAEVNQQLQDKIKELEESVLECDEIKLWNKEEPFNYNSGTQLGHLLYDILKIKPTVFTETGKPATNVEALEKLDNPLVKRILEIRKYQKLFGTYIHQFALEQTNGRIHAFTYLNRVETFRSSMGSINIQNQPARDKFAKKLIKSMVLPDKGQRLIGWDLKGAEVTVSACNSKDRELIKYVEDLTQDMHRQLCMFGFFLEEGEVTSTLRKGMKNTLTFPLFYNSYYVNIAPDLYEFAKEQNMLDHLAKHGVKNYAEFVEHVRKIEEHLWKDMFPKHRSWMKKQWDIYLKDGKLSIPTGFYVYAPMRKNNTPNTPIQGSAYHCNQRTFNKISAFIEEKNLKSRLLYQIHDAIYATVEPGEEDILDWAIWYYGTQEIRDEWKWLIATLYYEKEMGERDKDWSTLETVGLLGQDGKIIKK